MHRRALWPVGYVKKPERHMCLQPARHDAILSMLFPELASRIATGYGHAWKTGGVGINWRASHRAVPTGNAAHNTDYIGIPQACSIDESTRFGPILIWALPKFCFVQVFPWCRQRKTSYIKIPVTR